MEPDRLRTEASNSLGIFSVFVLNDGKMTEYGEKLTNSSGKVSWHIHEYAPSIVGGTDDAYFKTEYGCLYGVCMASWVGSRRYFPDFLGRRIRASEIIRRERLDGNDCTVVRFEQSYENEGARIDLFWFDDLGTLLRWTTEDRDGLALQQSDRRFRNIFFDDSIPESTWSRPPSE